MSTNGTSPHQYVTPSMLRQRALADVTLPSGLLVQIRFIQQLDLLGAWELPLPQADTAEVARPSMTEAFSTYETYGHIADCAIVAGCVQPRFAPRQATEVPEEVAQLQDLDSNDYYALAAAILRHSGLTPEVATAIDSFRDDAQRAPGRPDGGEVSPAATSDPGHDAGRVLSESPAGPDRSAAADAAAIEWATEAAHGGDAGAGGSV